MEQSQNVLGTKSTHTTGTSKEKTSDMGGKTQFKHKDPF